MMEEIHFIGLSIKLLFCGNIFIHRVIDKWISSGSISIPKHSMWIMDEWIRMTQCQILLLSVVFSSTRLDAGLMHSSDLAELTERRNALIWTCQGKTSNNKIPAMITTKSPSHESVTTTLDLNYIYDLHIFCTCWFSSCWKHFSLYLQCPVLDIIGEHEALALVWTAPTLGDRGPASISADLWEAGHSRAIRAANK